MTLEPTVSLLRRQGEVERHSITSRIPMGTCVVVKGTRIYTVRECVYVDAHEVVFTKVKLFQQVNATFKSVCGARGGSKGRDETFAFGCRFDIVDRWSGGIHCC